METVANNKLIAEFLGMETMTRTQNGWEVAKFNFHNSWDSLMMAVEKIESNMFDITKTKHYKKYVKQKYNITKMQGEIILGYDCNTDFKGWYFSVSLGVMPSIQIFENGDRYQTKIEACYNAVINFIKWYNENK